MRRGKSASSGIGKAVVLALLLIGAPQAYFHFQQVKEPERSAWAQGGSQAGIGSPGVTVTSPGSATIESNWATNPQPVSPELKFGLLSEEEKAEMLPTPEGVRGAVQRPTEVDLSFLDQPPQMAGIAAPETGCRCECPSDVPSPVPTTPSE